MKTYTVTTRTEVQLTKEQYKAYLAERKDMYTRLIKEQDDKLARAKKSWSKKVDEFEAYQKKIDAEIKALDATVEM